jgi:hypothetical protein
VGVIFISIFYALKKIEIKIFCSYFVLTFLKSGKMEKEFIDLCKKGDLIGLKQLLQINPELNHLYMIHPIKKTPITIFEEAFRLACEKGYLDVAQWLLQIKPEIDWSRPAGLTHSLFISCAYGHLHLAQWIYQLYNKPDDISLNMDIVFIHTCSNGHLEVAQWLLRTFRSIDISHDEDCAFRWTYNEGHYHIVKWLQSLKPDAYKLEYDENGKMIGYKIEQKNFL